MARLMAFAIVFEEWLAEGKVRDYAELAEITGYDRSRITRIMNLRLLEPGGVIKSAGRGSWVRCVRRKCRKRFMASWSAPSIVALARGRQGTPAWGAVLPKRRSSAHSKRFRTWRTALKSVSHCHACQWTMVATLAKLEPRPHTFNHTLEPGEQELMLEKVK